MGSAEELWCTLKMPGRGRRGGSEQEENKTLEPGERGVEKEENSGEKSIRKERGGREEPVI